MPGKMSKAEIESIVSRQLNETVETAIRKCVDDLNARGYDFQPVDEFVDEWREQGSDRRLFIHCVLGVDCKDEPDGVPVYDPVMDAFIARAESGKDPEAELLNLMEGDISNGGFSQLYDNKGISFMKRAAALLKKIGSDSAWGLVNQAMDLLEDNGKAIDDYARLQVSLYRLDEMYYDQEESVPALFEKYRNRR